ncbi:MAG TPA: hypothetical protein DDY18_03960 [Flavobacterium sp.]|nr:hypothetical protein [Flavobacterium sp.]
MLSFNGWTQNQPDTTMIIKTNETTYKLGEVISVFLKGTIVSTGDCDSGPWWRLEIRKDTTWENTHETPSGMLCGLPWVYGSNSALTIFTVGNLPEKLPQGEYRLLFMSKSGRIVETNSFFIE